MAKICNKCNTSIGTRSQKIDCGFCLRLFHGKCVQLTDTQIKNMEGFYWKCIDCKNNENTSTVLNGNISENENLIDVIKELKESVLSLKQEIQELKAEKKTNFNIEDVIKEMGERDSRKNNIILFNLSEANGSIEEKKKLDMESAVNVLNKISNLVDFSNISTYRLGKNTTSDIIRPLKIKLKSHDDAMTIIKNKRKLKSLEETKHITIAADNTPMQRDYFNKIKEELATRIEEGVGGSEGGGERSTCSVCSTVYRCHPHRARRARNRFNCPNGHLTLKMGSCFILLLLLLLLL
ncbi:unnamed protein product [Brassicogethes aeneus]|uniref:PHD-type domain-containing protein n=1 Tax=Brassicogethes aeneus TaxID=1431903 RepID=A0A9P0B3K0_BRAAE|nr:unnamed protein product [Brassicogethes aeneus]